MARKQKTIHYLYKTTCLVTGRYYIGMHSTSNLDDGYIGSGKRLRYSIRKYGVDNHKKEIIEFFDTRELLVEAEKKAITPEMITDKNCMNIKEGGIGGFINEEHMMKCSKAGNISYKNKLDNDIVFAKKITDRASKVMRKNHEEGKIKYNQFEGKIHSDKTKQIMSDKAKERTGYNNSQYGTCWITNEIESKKIFKGDLIPDGWRLGRKIKTTK